MEFLNEYGIFLAKTLTWVLAILVIVGAIAAAGQRQRKPGAPGALEIRHINKDLEELASSLKETVVDKHSPKEEQKAKRKEEKQKAKAEKKQAKNKDNSQKENKKSIYVIDFEGDIKASAVSSLRQEITALLEVAKSGDEVVLKLNSAGGMVHTYGLASSQLKRIKDRGLQLTISIDEVAASGGYMMACVGDKILAAPFAILGSIGVVAQLPNVHRLLKKYDVDYELLTAGEYKRTLTVFGENTEKGRQKFIEDLEDTHKLFKEFVSTHRPAVDISEVATGETWFGTRAVDKNLVDELITSDEYLSSACKEANVYSLSYEEKKSLQERLPHLLQNTLDRVLLTWLERLDRLRLLNK